MKLLFFVLLPAVLIATTQCQVETTTPKNLSSERTVKENTIYALAYAAIPVISLTILVILHHYGKMRIKQMNRVIPADVELKTITICKGKIESAKESSPYINPSCI
uniref:Col_cuticle_N domain-containing protein n=1 Tax=Caenorhabditis tropicalis TaxID=1561998 RepID=A0A1I7TLQ1_9PELO